MNGMRSRQNPEADDGARSARPARTMTRQTGMTWPPAAPFALVLQRAQAADQQAMSMIYKRMLPVVYRYALARVGDTHVAEDVTSETFFAVVEHIADTRAHDELTFAAWTLGIARNQVAMHFRRLRSHPETYLDSDDSDSALAPLAQRIQRDPLEIITARERWAEVVAALDHLTDEQRSVILYRCVLGYSSEEVAQLLRKQPGAIRALQFRALASLSRYLALAEPEVSTPPYESASPERRVRRGE